MRLCGTDPFSMSTRILRATFFFLLAWCSACTSTSMRNGSASLPARIKLPCSAFLQFEGESRRLSIYMGDANTLQAEGMTKYRLILRVAPAGWAEGIAVESSDFRPQTPTTGLIMPEHFTTEMWCAPSFETIYIDGKEVNALQFWRMAHRIDQRFVIEVDKTGKYSH